MTNKLTSSEYQTIKDFAYCVVCFKEGLRSYTHSNLSILEATEIIIKSQKEGKICLVIPSSNTNGIKGLGLRDYNKEEETLNYYLKCLGDETQ